MYKRFPISGLFLVLIIIGVGVSQVRGADYSQLPDPNYLYMPVVRNQPAPRWIGPIGGSGIALATSPINSSIVYVGTGCGVYKSTNGGESWFSTGPGFCYMIDSLAVDPTNPDIVYVGSHGGGVYKSINGGSDWIAANNGIHAFAVVYTVTVNPGNPDLVYAGTRGAPGSGGPPWSGVLYKSTNGGASWTAVLRNIGGSDQQDWVYSVRANPNQPNYIIAASHEHGPFVSNDYGNLGTWSGQNTSVDGSGRAIGFDPRSWVHTVFYATWHRTGIYRSSDNGYNWALSNSGLGEAKIYPNGIAFDLNTPSNIYMASYADAVHGVMKSSNSGNSWFLAGLSNRYIYSVASPGRGNDVVLAGTYLDGVYKSTNGGASWYKSSNGITNTNVTGVAIASASTYLVSVPGNGVYRSNDSGSGWYGFNSGLSDLEIKGLVSHPTNPNIVFALTSTTGVKRIDLASGGGWGSTDLTAEVHPDELSPAAHDEQPDVQEPMIEMLGHIPGQNEVNQAPSQPEQMAATITAPVLSMVFAPSNSNMAYLVTNGAGLYYSSNAGLSWERSGLTTGAIRAIAVHPTNSALLYAATSTTGLVKQSANGGLNWADLPLITGNPPVHTVMVSPAEPTIVYAGTSNGIWRYNGSSWSFTGLGGHTINALKTNPNNPSSYYAASIYGAYISKDHTNWSLIPQTNQISVQAIQFSTIANHSYVYLATNSHGVLQMIVED